MSKIKAWCMGLAVAGAVAAAVVIMAGRPAGPGTAIDVPGLAALNKNGLASVSSVSCASAGNCAAGGYYNASATSARLDHPEGFVVSERDGRWGTAIEVPGLGTLNEGGVIGLMPRWCRCRAPRLAAARPAGSIRTRTAVRKGSWSANGMAAGAGRSGCLA